MDKEMCPAHGGLSPWQTLHGIPAEGRSTVTVTVTACAAHAADDATDLNEAAGPVGGGGDAREHGAEPRHIQRIRRMLDACDSTPVAKYNSVIRKYAA